MKIEVKPTKTIEPVYLQVVAEVRYWEDSTVNGVQDDDGTLMPCPKGEAWCPVIRLSDGKIMGWPEGTTADIHYKVCDQGQYWLIDSSLNKIAKWKDCYVPDDLLCHGDEGYGDYIIFKVDEHGQILEYQEPELDPDEWEAIA